jgi:hypothetical protein
MKKYEFGEATDYIYYPSKNVISSKWFSLTFKWLKERIITETNGPLSEVGRVT